MSGEPPTLQPSSTSMTGGTSTAFSTPPPNSHHHHHQPSASQHDVGKSDVKPQQHPAQQAHSFAIPPMFNLPTPGNTTELMNQQIDKVLAK